MKRRVVIVVLVLAALSAGATVAGDPVVVVHEQRPETNLSAWRVRILLNGEEPLWENGDRVRLLLPPEDSAETSERLYAFAGRSPFELRKSWVDKVFRGEAVALPLRPPTVDDLFRELQADPGALGIVPAKALADGIPKGLKVLTVGGKSAGEIGYALSGAVTADGDS